MKRSIALAALVIVTASCSGVDRVTAPPAQPPSDISADVVAAAKKPAGSWNLVPHGGGVLAPLPVGGVGLRAIFWGSEWNSGNAKWLGDKKNITIFLSHYGALYGGILNQYGSTGLTVYFGEQTDGNAAPRAGVDVRNNPDLVRDVVCRQTNNAPNGNIIYIVYGSTSQGPNHDGGWHWYGNCPATGAGLIFVYVPQPAGGFAEPGGEKKTGHSVALSGMANVTAHELAETITDPFVNTWFSNHPNEVYGTEIADKCVGLSSAVTLPNGGGLWFVTKLWSNAAYNTQSGAPNLAGLRGCVGG
ncbi:MAG: hypothetical protein M3081_18470 [Gemmatimonadota bacterium]|nr:hypothetical protein [Gemmatimonadota bacterium]